MTEATSNFETSVNFYYIRGAMINGRNKKCIKDIWEDDMKGNI